MTEHNNAREGLRLLFIAEILQIVIAVLAVVPVLNLLAGIGGIVIIVITLLGLKKAGADHPLYKKAFTFSVVQLIIAFVGILVAGIVTIFDASAGTIIGGFSELVGTVFDILIVFYILTATEILLGEGGHEEDALYGKTTWTIYLWTYAAAAIISILASFNVLALNAIAMIGAVVAAVLEIIAGVRYIIFLNRAKEKA